jgi:TATA-binding protein-associated factor Taf7
MEKRKKRKW